MSHLKRFSAAAFMPGDPARAMMLAALLDGRALPAGELAYACGITAQAASAHLAGLLAEQLVAVETEGRHRYYRLAGAHVAQMFERLAGARTEGFVKRRALGPKARELRFCRHCYGHLAGQAGVAITRRLQELDCIRAAPDKRFVVTPVGIDWFGAIGVDVTTLRPARLGLARQCLDWTERTHHLAGPLGTRLLSVFCTSGWLQRETESRSLRITPKGWAGLKRHLDLDSDSIAIG